MFSLHFRAIFDRLRILQKIWPVYVTKLVIKQTKTPKSLNLSEMAQEGDKSLRKTVEIGDDERQKPKPTQNKNL